MSSFSVKKKKKKGRGGGVARGRRYTALLSVTPPLGPSPHIRRAAKRQSNRRSACDATCARRRNDAHSQRPAEIPHLFSHMLKMHLIDGGEIRSLWYMHLAGLSDKRRWKGAALSEWQEHYQSIFHRCQRGLVPVSSSGCHLLNEGMKGMFKVEIQACPDEGLYTVRGRKIAFEPQIQNQASGEFNYWPNSNSRSHAACMLQVQNSFLG